jgi:hypothetical protein
MFIGSIGFILLSIMRLRLAALSPGIYLDEPKVLIVAGFQAQRVMRFAKTGRHEWRPYNQLPR